MKPEGPDSMPWTILREDETTEDTYECPRFHLDEGANHLVELSDACELLGSLPYSGGVGQQPGYLIDAFRAIAKRRNYWRVKKAAKA